MAPAPSGAPPAGAAGAAGAGAGGGGAGSSFFPHPAKAKVETKRATTEYEMNLFPILFTSFHTSKTLEVKIVFFYCITTDKLQGKHGRVVTHFALRSFTAFRMTIAPYVILSGSEESLLLSPANCHGSK